MDFSNITTPEAYVETAFLAREAAQEMLTRLELMNLEPQAVLDLGCGTGEEVERLAQRFPKARILGVDLAQSFLSFGKKQRGGNLAWLTADSHTLPLRSHSVDFIFANLLLPWTKDPAAILREWRRVLRPQGLVLFSCLGPDSFKEWSAQEQQKILPGLVDMHNVGDALLEQGFVDPVLEVDQLVFRYRSEAKCWAELEKSGLCSSGPRAPSTTEREYPLTFEVVYGHAWCPATPAGFKPDEQGTVKIPISELKKTRVGSSNNF